MNLFMGLVQFIVPHREWHNQFTNAILFKNVPVNVKSVQI